MESVVFLILLIFAVFGFSEFLHILKLLIIFPKAKVNSHLVVRLKNDTAEKQTLYTCEQFCWYGKKFADTLVFDCTGLDNDIYERCRKLGERYGIKI